MNIKIKKILLIVALFFAVKTTMSQQLDSTMSVDVITIAGQYVPSQGIELRWFPSNRYILTEGLKHGYRIERTTISSDTSITSDFALLKIIVPYSNQDWDATIQSNSNLNQDLRELSKNYSEILKTKVNNPFVIQNDGKNLEERKKQEENEYSYIMLAALQDKEIAKGLGIGFVDNSVVSGQRYLYRAVINFPKLIKKNTIIKSHIEIVSMEREVAAISKPDPVNKTFTVIVKDKALQLKWAEEPDLAGYYISRSLEGSTIETKLNETPLFRLSGAEYFGPVFNTFEDKELINNRKYVYRIYANTIFADKVLVATVEGTPRDLTPPSPPFLEGPKTENGQIILRWKMDNIPADLKGFNVYRGKEREGNFIKINSSILPDISRTYSDSGYEMEHENYYKIEAIDLKDNKSLSNPVFALVIDSIPPSRPKDILANISREGDVEIVIPRQIDDDIVGYKIFKANQQDHEFSVVHEYFPKDSVKFFERNEKYVFTEKIPLDNLTPEIFYKVRTYDRNFNESEFSDTQLLEKPDIVPPNEPIIRNIEVSTMGIHLEIVKPTDHDLKSVDVYRQISGNREWRLVKSYPKGDVTVESYLDRNIQPNQTYKYKVQSIDNHGLKSSDINIVSAKSINNSRVETATKLRARATKDGKINLSWNSNSKDSYYVIFRSVNNGSFKSISNTNSLNYIDKRPPSGLLKYKVKTFVKTGSSSEFSAEVSLRN